MSRSALSVSTMRGPTWRSEWHQPLQLFAGILVAAVLVLIGVKPLLDIPGEKVAYDVVDAGAVATTTGAVLMVLAFLLVAATTRTFPKQLVPAFIALVLLGALSVINLLAVPARADFLQLFQVSGLRDIFGPYVPPAKGNLTQAAQFAVGFAAVALIGLMLVRPNWFTLHRLRWVLLLVLLGAVVHSIIAWLQVAGVVPYTFFFKLPGGNIGRASGGYFHPASLGRLLIFAVFILYAAGDRLRLHTLVRLLAIALMVATALVTMHRVTILCVGLVVVAMEVRRLPQLLRWLARLPIRVTVAAGIALTVLLAALMLRWGISLWERGRFLLTQIGSLDVTSKNFMRGRGEIWQKYADAWGGAPLDVWLLGVGYEPWNTHSDPLRVFVVWGLLGVVLMTIVFVTLWWLARKLVNAEGRWALAVLYVATAAFALTQKPTAYPYFMWLFFLCHMLLIATHPRADTLPMGTTSNGGHR